MNEQKIISFIQGVLSTYFIIQVVGLTMRELKCKHKETLITGEYYVECHGMHLAEYKEICKKCKKSRYFAYGAFSEWR